MSKRFTNDDKAPVPYNEHDRLEALYKLDVLDSETDDDLDRITKLVSKHLQVPICLVSLIDKNRQWFKACYGVVEKETHRDIAFCAHTILHTDILVVPDTTIDERFKNNPLVTGEHNVRFYAGAPIQSVDGYNLGTLCVLDTEARHDFDSNKQEILKEYSLIVANILNNKKQIIQVEDATKAKSEFLSHISHELRTPLNVVTGIANILKNKTCLDAHSKSLVGTLSVSADSLVELVNSVLDISAIEARSFTLSEERFSFQNLLDEIGSIMGARAKDKGLTFIVDGESLKNTFYNGDKLRLKQVLINLLGNAIKFTEKGLVTLTANYAVSSDSKVGMIEFQVIDTGIGIQENKLDKIFGRFEQAHNKSHYEGTGLGLTISKEIIEKMNGTIHVESREGFGTKFFVTIPDKSVAKPKKDMNEGSLKQNNDLNSVTTRKTKSSCEFIILVAEDYAANATLIDYILKDFGYNCEVVSNGQAVLDRLSEENFDLILMDINMPVLNGIETTKIIRETPQYKHIPIIAMSAHVFDKERRECMDAGVDDYITKPLDNDVLYEKLKQHLSEESNKAQL